MNVSSFMGLQTTLRGLLASVQIAVGALVPEDPRQRVLLVVGALGCGEQGGAART